ncbi:MAG: hypothetical protein J6Y37_06820 [Paludibacteraceae bacterium]|nr:hypothetical protein [Paludibacteraceae bacterium]
MKHGYTIIGVVAAFCCLPFFSSCTKEEGDKYYPITAEPSDSLMGYVSGGGKYRAGDVVKLIATPVPGYEFFKWDDGNTDNPRMVDVKNVGVYTAIFRVKNEGVMAEHLSGVIKGDLVLKDKGLKIDYVVDSALIVDNSALLTIEPGVTLEFAGEKACIIVEDGAALRMAGKDASPIILQGPNDNSNKGSWGYVEYRSGRMENEMTYVRINNGGCDKQDAVLRLTGNASISIQYCTLAGGLGMGISSFEAEGNPFKSFVGNRISNMDSYAMHISLMQVNHLGAGNQYPNNKNCILVSDSLIEAGAITFSNQGISYLMDGDLTVGEDGILVMEAGVNLSFKQDAKLLVTTEGTLQVNGTYSSLVSIRGMQDGVPGYWKGVDFQSNRNAFGGNKLYYCLVNGGGSEDNGACLTLADEVKLDMKGAQFFNSGHYGLKVRLNPETAKVDGVTSESIKFANNKSGNVYDATTDQTLPELP